MIQLNRQYGKDYADNLIDYQLAFNDPQTWSVTSGTGAADINISKAFQGESCLKIQNTAPTNDLTITNATQSTVIPYASDYKFSMYVLKEEVDEYFSIEVKMFQNAVLVSGSETELVIGSETTDEDVNNKWVRFMFDNSYALIRATL